MSKSLLPVVSVLLSFGCSSTPAKGPEGNRSVSASFIASAPQGFSRSHLGRPHNGRFELLPGELGATLFDEAKARTSPLGDLRHEIVEAKDAETFSANASAWGIASAEVEFSRSRNFVSRRLVNIKEVVELDETAGAADAPEDAAYYPWRVYLGWSYEVVCSGDAKTFGAEMKAEFMVVKGGVGDFSESNHLDCKAFGRGVNLKTNDGIFASSIEELEANFETGKAPVPVLVEWRRLRAPSEESSETAAGTPASGAASPCEKWSFTAFDWEVPAVKADGQDWDGDASPPEVQLRLVTEDVNLGSKPEPTYSVHWAFETPVLVETGATVTVRATDVDVVEDDPMGTFTSVVPPFLERGALLFPGGQGRLQGACVDEEVR